MLILIILKSNLVNSDPGLFCGERRENNEVAEEEELVSDARIRVTS
jgi:hypothetical protein